MNQWAEVTTEAERRRPARHQTPPTLRVIA